MKRKLAEHAGYGCSRPDCQAPTAGPHTDPAKSQNVGVAAHITAASKGGPRYDDTLTPQQRRSASNGIWMCRTHGTEVDNDADAFPVELLREWKRGAGERARKRLGRPAVDPISASRLRDERMRLAGPVLAAISDQRQLLRAWGGYYRGDKALHFALQPYRQRLLAAGLEQALTAAQAISTNVYKQLSFAVKRMKHFEAMVEDSAAYERSRARPPWMAPPPDPSPGEIPGLAEILDETDAALASAEAEIADYVNAHGP